MRFAALFLFAASISHAQVSVLTYHNDLARTGQNLAETALTKNALAAGRFMKLFSHAVDGYVYAQPLYVPGVYIPGKGPHNVVYAATEHDSVYAFDADSIDGGNLQPLWQVSFINPAAGVTTVPSQNVSCSQIVPEIGITGTPVIDTSTGTLYFVAMTLESGTYVHRLHALDLGTGVERPNSPVQIRASVPGTGEGGQTVTFNPRNYKQRPGLLLLNGIVYTSWSSHCDIGAYHGWLLGYDATTLQRVAIYNNTPNGNEGSFWASGAAPAVDSNGNIYVVAGNGTFDANNNGSDLGESFIKLSTTNGLQVADYFAPFNAASLNGRDLDIGSSGALLLPDSVGSAAHPHLLVSAGKEGRIYLVDRDRMGHFQSSGDSEIPQSLLGAISPLFGIPAYFNGSVYFSGVNDNLKAFSIRDGQLSNTPTSQSAARFGTLGSVPSVSANGTSDGIVWTVEPTSNGTLHAYDAADVSKELYNSQQRVADRLGTFVKFSTPTIANGRVYVGTQNTVAAFGLSSAVVPGGLTGAAVNAATFSVGAVAPGSIVSIFGSFPVSVASGIPAFLPTWLASASVRVNGVLAPLLYVSATQINAQVPFETPVGQNPIVVSIAGADWSSGVLMVQTTAPGLFTIAPGRAAVLNQDGTVNGPGNPAPVGSIVSAYLTGQGMVAPQIGTGSPAPFDPLSRAVANVTALVGSQSADVTFAGLSPGWVGLFQVNLRVPQIPSGDVSLSIAVGGVVSNVAAISVSDPPFK
jgi:uncharacterized protein (TIGR03437 family)